MQALRNASFLARLVLAWFALSLGAAVASPVLHPQGVQLVCSAGGALKLVLPADDGQAPQVRSGMDCPLCVSVDAPPAAQWAAGMAPWLARVLESGHPPFVDLSSARKALRDRPASRAAVVWLSSFRVSRCSA